MITEGKARIIARTIAEEVLGEVLPRTAIVHHVDGNIRNNRKDNLVICENQTYHILLHTRQKAYIATGDPNKRKCMFCKKYDNPTNLYFRPDGKGAYHKKCKRNSMRIWLKNNSEKHRQKGREYKRKWINKGNNREKVNQYLKEWRAKQKQSEGEQLNG